MELKKGKRGKQLPLCQLLPGHHRRFNRTCHPGTATFSWLLCLVGPAIVRLRLKGRNSKLKIQPIDWTDGRTVSFTAGSFEYLTQRHSYPLYIHM